MNILGPLISQQVLSSLSQPAKPTNVSGVLQQSTQRSEEQKSKDLRTLLTLIPSIYGLYKFGKVSSKTLAGLANSLGIQGNDTPTPLDKETTSILDEAQNSQDATEPQQEPTQQPEEPEIAPDQILKGLGDVDLNALSPNQQSRAGVLVEKIKELLQKGDLSPEEGKRLGILRSNLKKVIGAKGVVEEETKRFEDEYFGEQPKIEEGLNPGDIVNFKSGTKLASKDGQPIEARLVSVGDDSVVIEYDGKKRRLKKSQVKKKDKLSSAPIEDYVYDNKTGNLFVKFRSGNKPIYGYPGVSKKQFQKFAGGRATAKTSGELEGRRWWKGKNPSLGAAFFNYIRPIEDYSFLGNNADFNSAIKEFLNLEGKDE